MKVINKSNKVIFRKYEGDILVFEPNKEVEVKGLFNLSAGLELFTDVKKAVKQKPIVSHTKGKKPVKKGLFAKR